MAVPRATFAGPGALRALAGTRTGVVELTFSSGAYLRFGPDWVLLCDRSEPFGPLSLSVNSLGALDLWPGTRVELRSRRLVINGVSVSLERVRRRQVPRLGRGCDPRSGRPARTAAMTAAATLVALPAPPPALQPGIDALSSGRLCDGVSALGGLGQGLTPAGDDVLAGAAAALAPRRPERGHREPATTARMSKLAAGRASPLGLAYLRCAERGELPDAGAHLLNAIHQGSTRAVAEALAAARTWGASSGTALAWGLCAGLVGAPTRVCVPVSPTSDRPRAMH